MSCFTCLFVEGLCRDTVSINFPFFSRLKIEELEAERSKLEEENRSLEMKLEKLTVQVGNVEAQSIWTTWPCAPAVLPDVPEFSQRTTSLPSTQAKHFAEPVQTAPTHLSLWPCYWGDVRCSCLFRFLYLEALLLLLLGALKTVPF